MFTLWHTHHIPVGWSMYHDVATRTIEFVNKKSYTPEDDLQEWRDNMALETVLTNLTRNEGGYKMSKKESDFSNAITKVTIPAIIQTNTHRIEGNIHVMEWQRISDALNATEGLFLAVTDAVVLNFEGDEIKRCSFLAVNKEQVVWVIPVENPRAPEM